MRGGDVHLSGIGYFGGGAGQFFSPLPSSSGHSSLLSLALSFVGELLLRPLLLLAYAASGHIQEGGGGEIRGNGHGGRTGGFLGESVGK